MTILFLDDWNKYPGAIPHLSTTNESWKRLAGVYREMGIKNHAFPLALHNPDLQYVDPHNPEITREEILMVIEECYNNLWYFMREVARVPAKAGGEAKILEANRGNVATWWLFMQHITMILIQIRQTGKSLTSNLLARWLLNIRCSKTQINLLTKDDTLRVETIKALKEIEDELPFYLRLRTRNDINNSERLSILARGNHYLAHVPQSSVKNANKVGRGLTSPIFFVDEGPFQHHIDVALGAALTAGTAARKEAEEKGEPWGSVFTTTAGKRDEKEGRFFYKMLQESALWSERFFDAKNAEELHEMIKRNSPGGRLRVGITLNHIQLGKDDEWLRKTIEGAESVGPEDANRDFFNIWTNGTQQSPFLPETVVSIKSGQRAPVCTTISKIGGYITRWFIPENEIETRLTNGKYVLGMDISNAQGGDDISMVLMDLSTAEVIACGNYNETYIITIGEWLAEEWLVKYENITAIIERQNNGPAVIDLLLRLLPTKGIDPYKRLFNRVVNDFEVDPERFKEVAMSHVSRRRQESYLINKRTFGFATAGSGLASRYELYSSTLQSAAKRAGDKIHDPTTINQVLGLVNRNGRVDHQVGEHDDMVIAWLLCYWFAEKATNLSFYGIDFKTLAKTAKQKVVETPEEYYMSEEQDRIRGEMEEIFERLKNETNDVISSNLEHRLRALNRRLILEEGEVFSIDELISSLKDSKRQARVIKNNNGYQGSHSGNNRYNRPIEIPTYTDAPLTASNAYSRQYPTPYIPRMY